ncbi:cleavage and polyadenylation specificity factor subunit 4-like isoform X2 [Zophobas morio]|uniref:cleavage and polyadenylation specificity factor subunit 4-like isoform X2 n=1 Tax=Zophobas morio TaxID=2755281 RepID=UPI003083E635
MESIIANLNDVTFKIEVLLNRQIGLGISLFDKMDKINAEKCKYFVKGGCSKGSSCPFRHIRGVKSTVVCKHWMRGLCKKSDMCEFLHEFDLSKMAACHFYSTHKECSNGTDCLYLHIDPDSQMSECAWFTRGFCKHGPSCKHRHNKKVMCQNYLCGFCPSGPECKFTHPKWDIHKRDGEEIDDDEQIDEQNSRNFIDQPLRCKRPKDGSFEEIASPPPQ